MTKSSKPQVILVGLLALGGIALALWIASEIMWARAWRDTTPRGPLNARTDWPEPVRDIQAALTDAGVNAASFEVYLLYGEPGQTLSTVVCRLDDSSAAMDSLQAQLHLKTVSRDNAFQWAGSQVLYYSATDWWPSDHEDNVEYFASERLIAGDEADLYVVARDTTTNRIFIHYNYNF